MAKLIFSFILCSSLSAFSATIEFVNTVNIPTKKLFKKTRIGGLSALYYDDATKILYSVSDDRGRYGEPRYYEFKLQQKSDGKFTIEPSDVHFLKPREKKPLWRVLDLEGMMKLPWGDFLFSSEGDLNQRPRQQPQILDSKPAGKVVRTYELPEKFLPEPSGKQTKGVRNNNAFEGVAASPNGQITMVAAEASLVQDSDKPYKIVRFIQYETPEAWIIKPTKEYAYALEEPPKSKFEFELGHGVSDIVFDDNEHLLVMERALFASAKSLGFRVRIFRANLKDAKDVSQIASFKKTQPPLLPKEKFFDLDDIKKDLGGRIVNFEGLSWGPKQADGSRILIVVADDNFDKKLKTQFVFLRVKP